MSNLFILKAIQLKRKTKEDLIKEWKINNIQFNRDDTYENFYKFIESWGWHKFHYSEESVCFSDNFTDIEYKCLKNTCDINETVFNYCVIIEVFKEYIYPECDVQSIEVYSFNKETEEYVKVTKLNEEINYIIDKNNLFADKYKEELKIRERIELANNDNTRYTFKEVKELLNKK